MKLVQKAIQELQAEQIKLTLAIKALQHLNDFADANLPKENKRRGRKRRLSAAARARISKAQKARWAKARKAKKAV